MCTDAPPTLILHSIKIWNICYVCNLIADIIVFRIEKSCEKICFFFSHRNGFGINLRLTSVIVFAGMVFDRDLVGPPGLAQNDP